MYNVIEKIAAEQFEELEKVYTLKCRCNQCKEDILALALNRIPPRYTSSLKGELFVKSLYLDQQLLMDVSRELMRAALIVEHNQHHQQDESEPASDRGAEHL